MKTRLTIDGRLVRNSGIGVYIQNIVNSPLLQQSFEVTILARRADFDFFINLNLRYKPEEFNAELYSLKELLKASGTTIGTEIFWTPHYNVPALSFATKLNVVTIHDVYHLAYYDTLSFKQKVYAKYMLKKAVSADVIFTVSEFSKKEIVKHTSCDPQKIHVVYNGIDYPKFNSKSARDAEADVLDRYSLNSPYILYVGNVKPHKNLVKALLGFKLFIQNAKLASANIRFVIVGKKDGFITGDSAVSQLLTEAFFEDKVLFTGWVKDEDLPVLYQRALLFVFPSYYEGFGFPPLEAMAAGCPVISSNAACLPEIYENAALYFDPTKEKEIANAMQTIVSDDELRSELIEKGFAQAGKFRWEAAVERKIKIIEQML